MKSRKTQYLVGGIFLIFFGLKDFKNFNVFYNGIALALGLVAIILSLIMKKE